MAELIKRTGYKSDRKGFQAVVIESELISLEEKIETLADEIIKLSADLAISREGLRTFEPLYEQALIDKTQLATENERLQGLLQKHVVGQCKTCNYIASWPVCTKCGTPYPTALEKYEKSIPAI